MKYTEQQVYLVTILTQYVGKSLIINDGIELYKKGELVLWVDYNCNELCYNIDIPIKDFDTDWYFLHGICTEFDLTFVEITNKKSTILGK